MVFSHLPIAHSASDLLPVVVEHFNSLKVSQIQGSSSKQEAASSPFPFFFPLFQESDQVLAELQQAGICDFIAEPRAEFNFSKIPTFPFSMQDVRTSLQSLFDFINQQHQVNTTVFQEQGIHHRLNIPLNFFHFLRHLIDLSRQPIFNGQFKQIIQPMPIEDIQLIGSSVLGQLKEAPFKLAACHLFRSALKPDRIKKLFQMKHIQQAFNKININDRDYRILSKGDLRYQAYLNQMSVRYLALSISNFNFPFYIQKLKQKHIKYQNVSIENTEPIAIQEKCILEFGGIEKRKLVDLPKTQYAVLGLKTLKDKPADLLFVGLANQKPTLENLNLSTTNCWTVSIFNLLTNQTKKDWFLKIGCQPFSAAKALIDLLCGISTIPVPNVDAWRRFLRDCIRSMQGNIESQMVDNVFKYKNDFLQLKQAAGVRLEIDQVTDAQYIDYLLEEEILKNHLDCQTQTVNSIAAASYLFRACQSLQTYSHFSDQECSALWNLAHAKGWLDFSNSHHPSQNILIGIKKALIDEKVPFSVVSAWLGILAWSWAASSATSHCQRPVFHLKFPLRCLLPIQPIEQGQILQNYFASHPCPASFHLMHNAMASNPSTFNYSAILLPHFSELNIDPSDFKNLTENWLTHDSPLLNQVGLQLYLEFSKLVPDKRMLALIFQRLPRLLQGIRNLQHMQEILINLNSVASLASPGYSSALTQIYKQRGLKLKIHHWISILTGTQDRELLILAYTLWKENESQSAAFVRKHAVLGWSLYRSLCSHQPRLALSLLKSLYRPSLLLDPNYDEIAILTNLIKAYHTHAPHQLIVDLDQILPFVYPLFERETPLKFKNASQQQGFSQTLAILIDALHQHPMMEMSGDYFLLEAGRRQYVTKEWQTKIWFDRLKKIASRPFQASFAASIFQILIQENLLDAATPPIHRQQLRITLGEALLRDHQDPLSLSLLDQFAKEDVEIEAMRPFYEWTLHAFQNQTQRPIEEFSTQILDLLLLATPSYKRFETQVEFYQFFQHVIAVLRTIPLDSTLPKKFPLNSFDQFLGKKEIDSILNQADHEWKELLLDYLEASIRFTPQNRIADLWAVYEQIWKLFKKTKNTTHLLRLFKLLSQLLDHTAAASHQPNPKLLEWIKNQHETIFTQFRKQNCPTEAQSLVLALERYRLDHRSLAPHIWWICREELKNAPVLSSSLELLELDSFENIRAHIQPADHSSLIKVLAGVLQASPRRPLQAVNWANTCLDLQANEKIFQHLELMENGLTCAIQLADAKEWMLAFQLLSRLSSLSKEQLERAIPLWINIVSALHLTSTAEMSRDFFLNTQSVICKEAQNQLKSLVEGNIHYHLSQPAVSPLAKTLALDLIREYDLTEGGAWCNLWKALNAKQDGHLIVQAWTLFKTIAPSLTGTEIEITYSWNLAFHLLLRTGNADLLTYFNQHEWLKVFNHPSVLHLKWKTLEFVFLSAIHSLSPYEFDSEFFERILSWKDDLSSVSFSQEIKSSEFKLMTHQWNQNIELALIEHLQSSSNPVCLLAVAKLLFSPLKILAKDEQFLTIYLGHFERFVSSYLNLEDSPSKEYQDLKILVENTIDIICQTQKVPLIPCISIVNAMVRKPTMRHLELTQRLIERIITQGTAKEMEALKPGFLDFIPLFLHSEDPSRCIIAGNYLERAFNLMGLSFKEKGDLSHLLFQEEWSIQQQNPVLDDKRIDELMTIFIRWAPHCFAQPALLKDSLFKIATYLIPYASSVLENQLNQNKFNHCLAQILDVKYQVKLSSSPVHQESMQNYHAWAIEAVRHLNPKSNFLVKALEAYGETVFERVVSQQLDPSEAFLFLNDFVRTYPPQTIVWVEQPIAKSVRKGWKMSSHEAASKRLLKNAYQKNIFKSHPNDLLALEIFLAYPLSNTPLNKRYRPLYEKTIQQFLDYKTRFSISRAIQTCSLLQTKVLPPQEFKTLLSWHHHILQAIRPHLCSVVQNDETSHEPLFGYFHKQTLRLAPTDHPVARRDLAEVAEVHYQAALSFVKELLDIPDSTLFQAYYLSWCFQLLRMQAANGAFEKNFSSYLKILKELLPLVKLIEIKRDYQFTQDVPIACAKPTTLFTEWVELLIHADLFARNLSPLSIKASERKKQRELLFEGLQFISTIEEGDNLNRVHLNLVTAIIEILDQKKPLASFWMQPNQPDAVKLFESIKKTLALCPITAQKRLSFELIHHQFYIESDERDYSAYLKHTDFVIDLILEATLQEEFPFAEFSKGLLDIFLMAPRANPENYALQREAMFLKFFTTLRHVFEKIPQPSLEQAHSLLLTIMDKGIRYNLLHEENPTAIDNFEWAKNWIGPSQDPRLQFLQLTFYSQASWKTNLEEHTRQFSSLMPSLCQYVATHYDFFCSNHVVQHILNLPISRLDQFSFFVQWMHNFSIIETNDDQLIKRHLDTVVKTVNSLHIFDHVEYVQLSPAPQENKSNKLSTDAIAALLQSFYANKNMRGVKT